MSFFDLVKIGLRKSKDNPAFPEQNGFFYALVLCSS
jgi:hypothetical protein